MDILVIIVQIYVNNFVNNHILLILLHHHVCKNVLNLNYYLVNHLIEHALINVLKQHMLIMIVNNVLNNVHQKMILIINMILLDIIKLMNV